MSDKKLDTSGVSKLHELRIHEIGSLGLSITRNAKEACFTRKEIAVIIYDAAVRILLEYMPKEPTKTGNAYKNTIKNLNAAICKKTPQLSLEKSTSARQLQGA